MEQKTINQNKLQTLLCIIALTLGVLVSAVLFTMPPVHAAGNLTSEYYVYNYFDLPSGRHSETKFTFSTSATNIVGISNLISDNYFTFSINFYDSVDRKLYSLPSNLCTWHTEGTYYKNPELNYSDDNISNHFLTTAYYGTYNSDNGLMSVTYECNFPVFDTYDHALAYVQNGNEDGMLNKPELPNNNDETYCFTGFTMNGKTARWNGTTERSYAKEVDVEEYVKVSYAWATTTEPDNLGELQPYDGEFSTSDKHLTLPWSEMENGKTDFQFIRQLKIVPCYRVPHLAYYIGQPVTIYYNADGSIDKISNPNTPGVLDESIPIPVLSVNNDNGTFLFTNAQNDYKFELKGRFWSTDDFYVFRKTPSLVWQYKYLTLLKNSLTTWVSVGDNMSTLSTYSFGDLGAESWNDLISTYPIENRNIITGEQQGWFSWANITGYNDAVTTLKTLLSTPYSLFNGYEVYVRYYVVCDDGSIKYSKWTHYFNNLADADGSTGSIVDDANNMNNGNQSDKGLTDSDIDNVENSGNSRNDVDAKPSSDFSVDISNVTELFSHFINILKSLYSGMGQLPSLINAIFGFLPSWVSTMIGVSLVVIVILRIIGR